MGEEKRREEEQERIEKLKLESPKEEILFCGAGGGRFAIPKKYILFRNGFAITASQGFAVDVIPSTVASPKGDMALSVNLAVLEEVELDCDFIWKLSEADRLYQEIVKIMEVKFS